MKTNKIKVSLDLNLVTMNLYSLKLENVNEAQCECICPQTTGRLIKEGLSLTSLSIVLSAERSVFLTDRWIYPRGPTVQYINSPLCRVG